MKNYSIEAWGETKAEQYINRLKDKLRSEAAKELPGHMHPFVPAPYRVISANQHLIVIQFDAKHLYVLAIFHHLMDLTSRIMQLEKLI